MKKIMLIADSEHLKISKNCRILIEIESVSASKDESMIEKDEKNTEQITKNLMNSTVDLILITHDVSLENLIDELTNDSKDRDDEKFEEFED
jgi:hypothetical protein